MSGFEIPTLRSPRLVLRAFRADDMPAYAAMLGDPAVAQFLGAGKPRDPAESWEAAARALGQWAMRGYGLFAVEHDGALVGHAGLLFPPAWPHVELAYAIAPAAQRRGFATEAAQTVRAWAAEALGLGDLVSFIRPANAPSIAVAFTLLIAVPRRLLIVAFVAGDGFEAAFLLMAREPGIARDFPGATATERLIAPAFALAPSVLLLRLREVC
jgi:RimJ/RimL family protein N-acetyltransferase